MIDMKQITAPLPEKHIFVCINVREEGRDCCSAVGGVEVFRKIKEYVMSRGLASRIWITRTGCLGFCNNVGATVVIYPDQLWFKEVKKDEVQKIKDFILDAVK